MTEGIVPEGTKAVEPVSSSRCFTDNGEFTIISGEMVERGKYYLDTRPVAHSNDERNPRFVWESLLEIKPENQLLNPESDDIPAAYREQGEVYTLWGLNQDKLGIKSKMFHEKILELMRHNTPAQDIDNEVQNIINDINALYDSNRGLLP